MSWSQRVSLVRVSRVNVSLVFCITSAAQILFGLCPDVTAASLAARDEAFGYADRFDEKYDLCRSLRKGRYKYIRHYQAFYPDGLHMKIKDAQVDRRIMYLKSP